MNFVQLFFNDSDQNGVWLDYFIFPRKGSDAGFHCFCHFLNTVYDNLNEYLEKFTLIEYIRWNIKNNYYVNICYDEFYLPNRQATFNEHYGHYNLFYGFDDEKRVFYIIGFSTNSEGVILSLQELREYIISNKQFTIERINSNDDFDRSNNSSKNKIEVSMFKTKVISYMAKNTFRFSSLQECFLQPDKKIKRIIEYNLIPKHYIQLPYNTSICLKNRQQFVEKFISNENVFWSLPNVNDYLLAKI